MCVHVSMCTCLKNQLDQHRMENVSHINQIRRYYIMCNDEFIKGGQPKIFTAQNVLCAIQQWPVYDFQHWNDCKNKFEHVVHLISHSAFVTKTYLKRWTMVKTWQEKPNVCDVCVGCCKAKTNIQTDSVYMNRVEKKKHEFGDHYKLRTIQQLDIAATGYKMANKLHMYNTCAVFVCAFFVLFSQMFLCVCVPLLQNSHSSNIL